MKKLIRPTKQNDIVIIAPANGPVKHVPVIAWEIVDNKLKSPILPWQVGPEENWAISTNQGLYCPNTKRHYERAEDWLAVVRPHDRVAYPRFR